MNKSGWVSKRSKWIGSWRSRYCSVRSLESVISFSNDESSLPHMSFSLLHIKSVRFVGKGVYGKLYVFEILMIDGSKTAVCVSSENERNEWIRAISAKSAIVSSPQKSSSIQSTSTTSSESTTDDCEYIYNYDMNVIEDSLSKRPYRGPSLSRQQMKIMSTPHSEYSNEPFTIQIDHTRKVSVYYVHIKVIMVESGAMLKINEATKEMIVIMSGFSVIKEKEDEQLYMYDIEDKCIYIKNSEGFPLKYKGNLFTAEQLKVITNENESYHEYLFGVLADDVSKVVFISDEVTQCILDSNGDLHEIRDSDVTVKSISDVICYYYSIEKQRVVEYVLGGPYDGPTLSLAQINVISAPNTIYTEQLFFIKVNNEGTNIMYLNIDVLLCEDGYMFTGLQGAEEDLKAISPGFEGEENYDHSENIFRYSSEDKCIYVVSPLGFELKYSGKLTDNQMRIIIDSTQEYFECDFEIRTINNVLKIIFYTSESGPPTIVDC